MSCGWWLTDVDCIYVVDRYGFTGIILDPVNTSCIDASFGVLILRSKGENLWDQWGGNDNHFF